MRRADASAAASVTRTTSSARFRSTGLRQALRDAQADRGALHRLHATNLAQRRLHVALARLVRADDDRHDGRLAAALLDHGANTNRMPSEDASNVAEDAGAVARHDAEIICRAQLAHRNE